MKLPIVDIKIVMFIGIFAFSIQAICSIALFFINISFVNIWSATSTWAGVMFNIILAYFFYCTYKDMTRTAVNTSSAGLVAGQAIIDDFFKKNKEDKG
jgi:hypothetical protein